ncbi:uncharacterized protein YdcH (DUF465 family) [Dysgonomonas sp. PH5-45]|uniref:hypothetical protein n=1 Tax=unclassified Dysgonomonas TaxID=2630389 RepID=UPI002475AF1F|nr:MULTISPECIES: hypothetical protein [unclassified Dysgonomonas]MDH6353756.1 uncharacterized protein YdcH (DUF465 family) [Dysgonomonas sp. PH5-45]MDH6386659.1 uncharacterized protein YdcH (DUF465 family) [Dysgonomonas sp. PH5-37]
MKRIVFIFLWINVFWVEKAFSDDRVDYITSGYYQLIYEADEALLDGDEELAFGKYQQAEKVTPLIEQNFYYEMSRYTDLLLKFGQYDNAIHYMNILVSEYGRDPSTFWNKNATYFASLQEHINTDSLLLALNQKLDAYYSPERNKLTNEIVQMLSNDVRIRNEVISKLKNNNDSEIIKDEIFIELQNVDIHNAKRILEIIKDHSFPNLALYGYKNLEKCSGLPALFLHISDKENIKGLFLRNVREGKCSPFVYAIIVDRETMMSENPKSYYAAYESIDDQIIDIENLDKRRLAIGMPTRKFQRKKLEWTMKQAAEYPEANE